MYLPSWIDDRYWRWQAQRPAYSYIEHNGRLGRWPPYQWLIKDRILYPVPNDETDYQFPATWVRRNIRRRA